MKKPKLKRIATVPKGEQVVLMNDRGFLMMRDFADYCKFNAPHFTHWIEPADFLGIPGAKLSERF